MTEDQIRDVIAQWRARADGLPHDRDYDRAEVAIHACADDLEALLTERPQPRRHPHLFQYCLFTLHSGGQSHWKIDCDALTDADWDTLALIARALVPRRSAVEGIPSGGLKLAKRLARDLVADGPLLIVDDVLTTGASFEQARAGREAIGVVVFARGACPSWVRPLFHVASPHELQKPLWSPTP